MKSWNVVVVSGEPLTRLGLIYLLKVDAGFGVVGETAETAHALELCVTHRPELVVLDLVLPRGDGVVLIKELHRAAPKTDVLVVTDLHDVMTVQRAFRAGAKAFVAKADDTLEVLAAVSAVRQGTRYVSRRIADGLLGELSCGAMASHRHADVSTLSDRELQVFRLVGAGMCGSAISKELGVSVKTVETHRQRIKEKLRLKNGAELNRRAVLAANGASH